MATAGLYDQLSVELGLLQDISARLNAALDAPADAGWRDAVSAVFEHLRAHLVKVFALEESAGYLEAVTAARPERVAEVRRLHAEHAELTQRLSEQMSALRRTGAPDGGGAAAQARQIRDLVAAVRAHEGREIQLLQVVFNTDVSVSD